MDELAVSPDRADRWESIYAERRVDRVSWYQPSPEPSLRLIEAFGFPLDTAIIDVGGGASLLVDRLLADGYCDVTVLDISSAALQVARERIGGTSGVTWVHADLLTWQPTRHYALWHDRAVFHFLVRHAERRVYLETLGRALTPTGAVIIGTFATDGPERCSGFPVARYDADDLGSVLGPGFAITKKLRELHKTPAGVEQPFTWVAARRRSNH